MKLPGRFLYYSFREDHTLFQKMHPQINCGSTTFFIKKPQDIRSFTKIDEQGCVCDLHVNMKMDVMSLTDSDNNKFKDVLNVDDPCKMSVCPLATSVCFNNKCNSCSNGKLLETQLDRCALDYQVVWTKWVINKDNTSYSRVQKTNIDESAEELLDWIVSQRAKFVLHVYVKRHQAMKFENTKNDEKDNPELAVINSKYQDAPQQANYGYNQVSNFFFLNKHKILRPQ